MCTFNHVKLWRTVHFVKCLVGLVSLIFSTENFSLKQNGISCINFSETGRDGKAGAKEYYLRKYETLCGLVPFERFKKREKHP